MWGEVSESKREKGRLGSREEGENRERQSPTLRWTETLHTWRDWERFRNVARVCVGGLTTAHHLHDHLA